MRQEEAGPPFRCLLRTIIAAAALAALAGVATAEPGPIGQWLMNQPVTLWDRGMDRALNAAKEAAKRTGPWPPRTVREGHAYYDWNANEITLQMSVIGEVGAGTHERCNELRHRFVAALAYGIPTASDGSVISLGAKGKKWLTEKIDGWFSHHGYRERSRDGKLGEKLARIVFVEVLIRDAHLRKKFECRARIFESEAASKPSG
ncbi:MAG: hypothetical protein OXH92_08250 [Bryobacterales bacterium]|nr:hypothetical protein [Bryobacterales bacterium]